MPVQAASGTSASGTSASGFGFGIVRSGQVECPGQLTFDGSRRQVRRPAAKSGDLTLPEIQCAVNLLEFADHIAHGSATFQSFSLGSAQTDDQRLCHESSPHFLVASGQGRRGDSSPLTPRRSTGTRTVAAVFGDPRPHLAGDQRAIGDRDRSAPAHDSPLTRGYGIQLVSCRDPDYISPAFPTRPPENSRTWSHGPGMNIS